MTRFDFVRIGALVLVAACSSKTAPPVDKGSAAATKPTETPPTPTETPTAAPTACTSIGRYTLALAWPAMKCQLGPASLTKLGFAIAKTGDAFAVTLDDGVQTPSSSPFYDDISVEKSDGCTVQVKFTQPPSHQIWAFLTLDLAIKGTTVSGTAKYDESFEGETCEGTVTVTGSFAP